MIGSVLALFLCFAVLVQGAIIQAPSPTRATATNDIVAFFLQNPTTSPITAHYITFGHPFFVTQLSLGGDNSSILTAYVVGSPTTTLDVQVDAKAFHADGSVRQATLTLLSPSIPANSSVQLMLTRTMRKVTGRTLASIPNSVLTLKLDSIVGSSATYTYDPSSLVKSSNNWWLYGDLAVQARVERWVMKAMRVVFDVTLYKDNTWCIDSIVSNDIAMGTEGGNITYDATFTSTGFNKVYSSLNHFQYAGWHKFVCSAGDSKVNVQYDQLNFIQARAVHPINYTIGVNDDPINDQNTEMQAATWGVPLATNGVSMYMPGTGDRRDIGALPVPHAVWFVSQDANAKKYMMGWGDTSHAVPWNYYVNTTGRYLNFWDYPNIWTDGRGNPKPTQLFDDQSGWAPETAHHPALASLPYVVSGQRYYVDLVKSVGAFVIVNTWSAGRGNFEQIKYIGQDKGLLSPANQLRGLAWSLRDLNWAAYLTETSDSWHKSYFTKTLEVNLEFILKNQTTKFSVIQGETAGWWSGSYPGNAYPPWQGDHFSNVLSMITMQGSSYARDILGWQRNFQIMSFFFPGWNTWNRFTYNMGTGPSNNDSIICNTYACLDRYTAERGQNVSNVGNIGGNYGQLARQTFILYQVINKNDQDAKNAQSRMDTSSVQAVNDDEFRKDPRTNAGNFPDPAGYTPPPTSSSSSSSSSPSSSTSSKSSSTSASSSTTSKSTSSPATSASSSPSPSAGVMCALSSPFLYLLLLWVALHC